MDIKFKNEREQIEVINLRVDTKWEDTTANSIFLDFFNKVDDGDGIISKSEMNTVKVLLKEADWDKDNVINFDETTSVVRCFKENYITAKLIYNDIYEKNNIGFPTTDKDISKHIEKIDKNNVISIISCYKKYCTNQKGICTDIMKERGLNIDTKIRYITHIFNALIDYCKSENIYVDDIVDKFNEELNYQKEDRRPADTERFDCLINELIARDEGMWMDKQSKNISYNGEIDKDFKQGPTEDCWLLASVKAIANQPKGLEILNDMIKVQSNGDVNVILKGVNRTYKFTKQEIEAHAEYATGDLDIRIIEMAVNKYFEEERGVQGSPDINRNFMYIAFDILTGKGNWNHVYKKGSRADKRINGKITDEQIDNFNKSNHVACVAAHEKKDLRAMNGCEAKLITGHAYMVSRSNSKYVYLINPYDTSTEIPVTRETFKEFFNYIDEFDL